MARTLPGFDSQSPEFQHLIALLRRQLAQDETFKSLTHFSDVEDYAIAAGNALAREVFGYSASQSAISVETPQPCPDCGTECAGKIATRDLKTRCGPVEFEEAKYHCPRCRRAFFPQQAEPGADSPQLQPKIDRSSGRGRRRRAVRSGGSAGP